MQFLSRHLLAVMAAVLLPACANKAPVVPPLVRESVPPKAEDVAPVISATRKTYSQADALGEVARAHVDSIGREARSLREGLDAVTVEAARLRDQKSAGEAELNGLWQSLQALTARNLFLESEVEKASAALEREKALRNKAFDEITRIQDMAAKKDSEALSLRLQLIDSEANREATHTTNTALAKASVKHQSRADQLAGEIRLYRIALGIIALLFLLWAVLKFFLPPRLL